MNRRTPAQRRVPAARNNPTPARGTPRSVLEVSRPEIPSALSNAYGAPGKVRMPNKVVQRQAGNMLEVMRDMVEDDDSLSNSLEEPDYDSVISEEEIVPKQQARYQNAAVPKKETYQEESEYSETESEDQRQIRRESQSVSASEIEEVDEVEIDSASEDDVNHRRRGHPKEPASSPFVAIANRIRKIWGASAGSIETSFMTEDKIASEARIARPREPLARQIINRRDKLRHFWREYNVSNTIKTLLVWLLSLIGFCFLLLALLQARPFLPDQETITTTFDGVRDAVTSPIYSIWDALPSRSPFVSSTQGPAQEIDLSQLKALKETTALQFKNLKSRLDNMESTYNRLASKVKAPAAPVRKINLFAPGSGLTVDPYLSSPTFTRDFVKKNVIGRIYGRWRGYPTSVVHGPISAFTPWEDMGDCWCSPNSGGRAQIVVDLGKSVVPQELVIEHVPKAATLQAGSAPKSFEVWAQIKEHRLRDAIIRGALHYNVHQKIADKDEEGLQTLDHTWVRLGQWIYDINAESNVQSFDIQVPLEEFKTSVRRLAFRTTSNWGPVDYVCLYRLKLHGIVAMDEEQLDGVGF